MRNSSLLFTLMAPLLITPLTAHSAPDLGHAFVPWTDLVLHADENGDGGLAIDEIERFRGHDQVKGFFPFMSKHFNDLDKDGDSKVTMHEIKMATMKMGMTDAEVSTGFKRDFMWDAAPN